MALTVTHSTAADGTFSTAGETAWEANHTVTGSALAIGDEVSGGTATRVLYVDGSGNFANSANLTFDDTNKRLTVGTGATTSAGWHLGYGGSSQTSMIWPTSITPSATNYTLYSDANTTVLNARGGTGLVLAINDSDAKFIQGPTAGLGPAIPAGTATTDVAAHSITRTNNNAAVATGVKWTFTDTTSAAGFLPFQILGGAAGTTNLLKVSKAGLVDAPAYSVAGTAGVDFSGAVLTLTIVKGIVTAAA